jgi:hypothetical protein
MPSSFPTVRSAFLQMTAEEKAAFRHSKHNYWVDAKLAITIANAVERVMLPDLLYEANLGSHQLTLVPIFAFRNHEEPFRPQEKYEGFAYDFDVAHVVKEIQGLQVCSLRIRSNTPLIGHVRA